MLGLRQLLRLGDHGGVSLDVALAPATLAGFTLLALASAFEFGDKRRLLELTDGAEDLPDQDRGRRVVNEGIWTVGGDQRDAEAVKESKAGFLNDQVARKPACRLDDDDADAVAGDTLQHRGEAARFDANPEATQFFVPNDVAHGWPRLGAVDHLFRQFRGRIGHVK